MPQFDPLLTLALAATALNGLLCCASLDQSIKQLPARHRIGMAAFSAYSRAADLGPGIAWYAALGIGAAVLTLAAAVVAYLRAAPLAPALPLYLAAATTLIHSFATTQAAPTNFRQRAVSGDAAALAKVFARFERWQTLRAAFQVLTFAFSLWALAAL